jgi:hypothetical protein
LKSSGLEARFEGFRGVGSFLKDFRGVFISDVETRTLHCVHAITLADNAPFLLLGPVSAATYAHQSRIHFCLFPPVSPLLVVIPIA